MGSKFSTSNKKKAMAKVVKAPQFWSYTRLQDYRKCPLQYRLKNIDKLPQPPSRALEKGIEWHKKAEHFLKGHIRGMPKELKSFGDEFKMLKKLGAAAEESWATDRNWKPCAGDDFNRAWVRFKADSSLYVPEEKELTVIDFKTGKMYSSHDDQGELGAVIGSAHHQDAKTIDVEFWYLESGDTKTFTFPLKGIPKLKKKFETEVGKMLRDRTFKATPSDDACRFCPYRSDKGGPCDAWKKA